MKNKSYPLSILLSLICIINLSCTANSQPQTVVRQPESIMRQAAASPTLKGSLDMVCAEDIAVRGKFLYVADGPGGLKVVDASSPSELKLVKTIRTTYAFRVYLNQDHLYLSDGPAGLKVYSLEDPSKPVQVYAYDTYWAEGISFANGYLYLADYYEGVKYFQLDASGVPITAGGKDVARARDIIVEGSSMLVSDHVFGIVGFVMDSPTDFLWTYTDAGIYANYEDIVSHNGYAIIARNDEISSLRVFSISDIYAIELVDDFHPVRFISGITGNKELLVAACGEDGVLGFDMTDPAALELNWVIHTNGSARRAHAHGEFLYVADMSGIGIYDIGGLAGDWE